MFARHTIYAYTTFVSFYASFFTVRSDRTARSFFFRSRIHRRYSDINIPVTRLNTYQQLRPTQSVAWFFFIQKLVVRSVTIVRRRFSSEKIRIYIYIFGNPRRSSRDIDWSGGERECLSDTRAARSMTVSDTIQIPFVARVAAVF